MLSHCLEPKRLQLENSFFHQFSNVSLFTLAMTQVDDHVGKRIIPLLIRMILRALQKIFKFVNSTAISAFMF